MPRRLIALVVIPLVTLLGVPPAAAARGNPPPVAVTGTRTDDGGRVQLDTGDDLGFSRSGRTPRPRGPDVVCRLFEPTGGAAGSLGLFGSEVDPAGSLTVGQPYLRRCFDVATGLEVGQLTVVIAEAPDPAVVALTLARRAAQSLPLDLPEIGTSPQGSTIVNVDTWLWVDGAGVETASASLGGVTATVRAVPTGVRWDTDDGGRLTCVGVAYDPARPAREQRSDCTHAFGVRTGPHEISATRVWHLTYSATNGEAGDLGLVERTASVTLEVRELITRIGG